MLSFQKKQTTMKKFIFLLSAVLLLYACSEPLICGCVFPMQTPEGNWKFVGYLLEDQVQLGDLKPRHSFEGTLNLEKGQALGNGTVTYPLNGRMAMNYLTGNYDFKTTNSQQGSLTISNLGSTKIGVTNEQAAFELNFYQRLSKAQRYDLSYPNALQISVSEPTNEVMIFKKAN